ncbi:PRC-barrel domain-containing protein [Aerosakkonema sp. BLCC-F183]|uniref:PRC-barrel domain-containing protein n=1 Tax=Aerosakkonema sp. BLCC-F183 TaxID=3342834 RepID=UPI0035B9335E
MNTEQSVIRHSELIDRLVLDRRTAEELGRVNNLWLNPKTNQVEGFTCKSGILGSKKRSFTWAQIQSIGADSIMVNFNSEEFADPQKSEDIYSLIGHEVWTEAGNKAGKLVDYLIVPQTGDVVNYLFASSGWRGILNVVYLIALTDIRSIGSKRLIVKNEAVEEPQPYGGLQEKLGQVAEIFKEDYKKTQAEFQALKRGVQDLTAQVKEKAQDIAERVKDRAEELGTGEEEKQQDAALPPAAEIIQVKAELITEDESEKSKDLS